MKRPVGVILSCIVLGLLALCQLLLAAAMVFGAFAMRHPVAASATHPEMPPPPAFVFAFVMGFAVILLLILAWTIATLIGLAMLRNWARYSILVLGGCITGFSIIAVFGIILVAIVSPQSPAAANLPPHTMQVLLAFYAFLYIILAAIGAWWLVYFNQRKTKAYFLPLYTADPALQPPPYPGAPPPPFLPPAPSNRAPTPIIVLACLYLVASLCCLLYCFLPFPVIIFGLVIRGHAVPVIYSATTLFTGLIGWGLIRLDNRARIAAFASLALGVINMLILMLPWGRAQLQLYSAELNAKMGLPQTTNSRLYSGPIIIASVVFGIAIYGGIAWLLHRYRYPFTGETLPPPDPLETPLVL